MSQRFSGMTAVVTGASRGIGLGVAKKLVDEGARVVITARNADTLSEAVASLGGAAHAVGIAGSADDVSHQAETVHAAIETFGSLDLLVNNTGSNYAQGPLVGLDLDDARKTVETNCVAALSWVQHAHRGWMGEHGGAIVNVSSIASVRPASRIGFYGATKAMLTYLTEQLAVELGPDIRVNAVAPAVVKTQFAAPLYAGREESVAETYPLKRLGEPADIANAVAFLLSDEAAWITGRLLVVDGGITLLGKDWDG
jgi:NAD(P)-dependent dehydrogenase (short-subunit alcohol dehydrogenase family)